MLQGSEQQTEYQFMFTVLFYLYCIYLNLNWLLFFLIFTQVKNNKMINNINTSVGSQPPRIGSAQIHSESWAVEVTWGNACRVLRADVLSDQSRSVMVDHSGHLTSFTPLSNCKMWTLASSFKCSCTAESSTRAHILPQVTSAWW